MFVSIVVVCCYCGGFREELIDADIEESVSVMQAVIELGRVIRDRRTMPNKVFPSFLLHDLDLVVWW